MISPTTRTASDPSVQNGTDIKKKAELDKDQFLKLLTTQLRYQDPLSPMDNQDFLAQMAQFSSLEQVTNLAIASSQQAFSSQMTQATSLIGKQVTWVADQDTGTTQTGVVDTVTVEDGLIYLKIGELTVQPHLVTQITTPPPGAAATS